VGEFAMICRKDRTREILSLSPEWKKLMPTTARKLVAVAISTT